MLKDNINNICPDCLQKKTTSKIVVGLGNKGASIMIIGEAPGAMEDQTGLPFQGRGGKKLKELLEKAKINESDIYMTNIIKCRPPKNRKPTKKEIQHALPWLHKQIELISPRIIVLTGATAAEAILGKIGQIGKIRGQWFEWREKKVMPIFHPAYILRNPSRERDSPYNTTLNDLINIRNKLKQLQLLILKKNFSV